MIIEAVVAISEGQEKKFNREIAELKENTPFQIGGDTIELYPAYYTEKAQSIRLEQDPFIYPAWEFSDLWFFFLWENEINWPSPTADANIRIDM